MSYLLITIFVLINSSSANVRNTLTSHDDSTDKGKYGYPIFVNNLYQIWVETVF